MYSLFVPTFLDRIRVILRHSMHLLTLLPIPYRPLTYLTLLLASGLTACSTTKSLTVPDVVKPYRPEIVQGNFVSREQVAALRAGMPRPQVKNILGTPLLMDVFHPNRWDYVFTIEKNGVIAKTRRLTVYFNGDVLDRWEGDEMPSEVEFVSSLPSGRQIGKIPPLSASEKELNDFSKRENANDKRAPLDPAPITPINKTYPPLESK